MAALILSVALGCAAFGAVRAHASAVEHDESAPRYAIREVLVQGAGVFKPDILRAVYGSVLSHPVTDAEIGDAADAVTDYYRRGGYFLATATVPRQRLDYGLLVLRVSEGDIADVVVEGDRSLYSPAMQAAIAHLLTVRPMTGPAFTQAMKTFAAAKGTRTVVELAPSPRGQGHYNLRLYLARGETGVVVASRADPDAVGDSISADAASLRGTGGNADSELALDLLPRMPESADMAATRTHRRPEIGPFYVPTPDGRENAYALLDHGPGWYKRSEDQAAIPTALGLRLRDDDTKVGFEAGIPYDRRVDGVDTRTRQDEVQVLFTVDRHF